MKDISRITAYGCVVAGVGPAGMGFLFNALKTGKLAQLARHGLLILDAGGIHRDAPLGAGRLGEYRITANSVGDVFLDCLRDPALAEVFAPLEGDPCLENIRAQAFTAPALSEVGALLEAASRLVLEHATRLAGVELWCGTSLDEVERIEDDNLLTLTHTPEHASRPTRIRTSNLVLNLGGYQCPEHLTQDLSRQGLSLSPRARIYSGDELLRMPEGQLRSLLLPRLRRGGRVCVVGGSHSAFSMLDLLASAFHKTRIDEITLLHRSPVRLFFENAEEAKAAGYSYDAERDVCPISGRINRSGGLRYRALSIGQQVLSSGRIADCDMQVRLIQTGPGPQQRLLAASEALADAPVVVQCNGYQPILPRLLDTTRQPLPLSQVKGGLDSDATGNPRDLSGNLLEGLYLFGLGAGLAADPTLGSEAAFDGRIYGVWQFHNNASLPALEAILARLETQHVAAPVTDPLSAATQLAEQAAPSSGAQRVKEAERELTTALSTLSETLSSPLRSSIA